MNRGLRPWRKSFRALALGAIVLAGTNELAAAPPPPLRIRVYGSLVAGFSRHDAEAASRPLLERLAEADLVGYPIDFRVYDNREASGLLALGDDLAAGRVEVGIVWGLEYGWLRGRHPDLRPLAIVFNSDLRYSAQLAVRSDALVKGPGDLPRPAKIADYRGSAMMSRLHLQDLTQLYPDLTFDALEQRPNARDAIRSVLAGDAHCTCCDTYTLETLRQTQPGLRAGVKVISSSEPFPEAVLIGAPERVNQLRKGLWDRLQSSTIRFCDTPEGKELVRYWRVQQFKAPDERYLNEVQAAVQKYPPPFP